MNALEVKKRQTYLRVLKSEEKEDGLSELVLGRWYKDKDATSPTDMGILFLRDVSRGWQGQENGITGKKKGEIVGDIRIALHFLNPLSFFFTSFPP